MQAMRKVAIVGAGMVRFGRYPGRSVEDMGTEACLNAFRDAGVDRKDVEAAFVGNEGNGPNAGQRILDEVGLSGIPTMNHENGCGSGAAAFHHAVRAVSLGACDRILVIGTEHLRGPGKAGHPTFRDGCNGSTGSGTAKPARFGLIGMRHMEVFGTTREQLAKISVKNRRHGAMNPYARYQGRVSLATVLGSDMVADPLTRLQCAHSGDGAAALLVTTMGTARRHTNKPVRVDASVFTGARYKPGSGAVGFECCVRASRIAYETAGIGPHDLDVAEIQDCSTVHELIATEDLGLCAKGEGGRLVEDGITALGGNMPVNPSGGLLSRGHPHGATGVAQIVELVWQLRGNCGRRQVKGAKVGLAHNTGGIASGLEPCAMSISIVSR